MKMLVHKSKQYQENDVLMLTMGLQKILLVIL